MYTLLVILHITAAILLILAVLLQVGKSAGLESIFGGGGEKLLSLPSGTAFLRKTTAVIAIIFIFTSLALTVVSYRIKARSVIEKIEISK